MRIDYGSCIGCGVCEAVCPLGLIKMSKALLLQGKFEKLVPRLRTSDACSGCLKCVESCPSKALKRK